MSKAKKTPAKVAPKPTAAPKKAAKAKATKAAPKKQPVKALTAKGKTVVAAAAKKVAQGSKPAKKPQGPTPATTPNTFNKPPARPEAATSPTPEPSAPTAGHVPLAPDEPSPVVAGYKFTEDGPAVAVGEDARPVVCAPAVDERGKPIQFATTDAGAGPIPTLGERIPAADFAPLDAEAGTVTHGRLANVGDSVQLAGAFPISDPSYVTTAGPTVPESLAGEPSNATYAHAVTSSGEWAAGSSQDETPNRGDSPAFDPPATPTGKTPLLTPEQYKALGERMLKTGGNVYRVVQELFGIDGSADGGEELFKGLKEHGGVFKCELCDTWKANEEQAGGMVSEVCNGCVDDGNGEGETD